MWNGFWLSVNSNPGFAYKPDKYVSIGSREGWMCILNALCNLSLKLLAWLLNAVSFYESDLGHFPLPITVLMISESQQTKEEDAISFCMRRWVYITGDLLNKNERKIGCQIFPRRADPFKRRLRDSGRNYQQKERENNLFMTWCGHFKTGFRGLIRALG